MPCFVVVALPMPGRYRRQAAILIGDHDEGRDRRRRNTGVLHRLRASDQRTLATSSEAVGSWHPT